MHLQECLNVMDVYTRVINKQTHPARRCDHAHVVETHKHINGGHLANIFYLVNEHSVCTVV